MKYFENFDLRQLNNLELLAKQVVEGFIIGLHKSPFHGFSVEFAEHRLYNPGESTKNVDWKVYGRTDKMYVKRYEEETNLRCQIVIDTSSSMYFPKGGDSMNKLQFSAVAAASLMNLLRKQRDAFGLSLFEDSVHVTTRAKSSTKHYNTMLTHLDRLIEDNTTEKTTATAKAFHEIADSIHKRSMVMIFSDMFDDGEHEEELFAAENRPYLFVDMESGEEIRLQSNQVKELYQEKVKAYAYDLKMKCLQYNIDFVEADINEGFHKVLQSYLVKRGKMK